MALAARKITRILIELLYLLHSKRKAEKLDNVNHIFANFHLERAENFYYTLINAY